MACRKLMTPLSLLMQRLPKLMCNTPPIFQDVKLTPMDYAKARCLGPHCQCGCENGNAQRVRVQIHGSKNCKNKKKGKCGNPLCQRKLYVPHWAAKDIAETMEILPRHQPLPKKMPQPGSAASKPGAFRHHLQDFANVSCPAHPWSRHGCRCPCTWNSRCLLPSQFYVDFKKLHQGLATGFAYIRILKQEMQSILGPVGVNTGMNDLSVAMSQCWDWAKTCYGRANSRAARRILVLLQTAGSVLAKLFVARSFPVPNEKKTLGSCSGRSPTAVQVTLLESPTCVRRPPKCSTRGVGFFQRLAQGLARWHQACAHMGHPMSGFCYSFL